MTRRAACPCWQRRACVFGAAGAGSASRVLVRCARSRVRPRQRRLQAPETAEREAIQAERRRRVAGPAWPVPAPSWRGDPVRTVERQGPQHASKLLEQAPAVLRETHCCTESSRAPSGAAAGAARLRLEAPARLFPGAWPWRDPAIAPASMGNASNNRFWWRRPPRCPPETSPMPPT